MSLYLCHECYFWVAPRHSRCPECDHPLSDHLGDPPLDNLQRVIGDVVARIGEVRFQRPLLPENGTLYLTSNGLYFVPHVLSRRTKVVEKTPPGRSLFWMLASTAFTPLMFVLPFLKSKQLRQEEVTVLHPQQIRLDGEHQLAELLIQNPGAFFLSRNAIRHIIRKRKLWTIERQFGEQLRFAPVINHDLVNTRLIALMAEDDWRDMAHV
ncbi:MAG: hypothetical protein Tsb009_37910 [Planctomycetaceae bacterium]